jgi:hypothetical protein
MMKKAPSPDVIDDGDPHYAVSTLVLLPKTRQPQQKPPQIYRQSD